MGGSGPTQHAKQTRTGPHRRKHSGRVALSCRAWPSLPALLSVASARVRGKLHADVLATRPYMQ